MISQLIFGKDIGKKKIRKSDIILRVIKST